METTGQLEVDLTCDERLVCDRGASHAAVRPVAGRGFLVKTFYYCLKRRVCLNWVGALWLTPRVALNFTGLVLASGCPGISAREEVYPFSVDGGRRINERKNALQPYALNGQLFR